MASRITSGVAIEKSDSPTCFFRLILRTKTQAYEHKTRTRPSSRWKDQRTASAQHGSPLLTRTKTNWLVGRRVQTDPRPYSLVPRRSDGHAAVVKDDAIHLSEQSAFTIERRPQVGKNNIGKFHNRGMNWQPSNPTTIVNR